jgi:hypothetical protein
MMIFSPRTNYGKNFFYPCDNKAKIFLNAFPTSSGKRKCLTPIQLKILKKIGISFKIKPQSADGILCKANKKGRNKDGNVIGNHGL